MAMIFESEEEGEFEQEMLEETDDDDDDYAPDGARSDSDPDFSGKRKSSRSSSRKSARSSRSSSSSSPPKRTRQSSSSSPPKRTRQSSKKESTFTSRRSAATQSKKKTSPAKKVSPAKKTRSPTKKLVPAKTVTRSTKERRTRSEESDSLRRSSRSSRGRSVSYADADLSEEEHFEDEDLSDESDDEVIQSDEELQKKKKQKSKKAAIKKKHAEDLWASFKGDDDKTKQKNDTGRKNDSETKNDTEKKTVNDDSSIDAKSSKSSETVSLKTTEPVEEESKTYNPNKTKEESASSTEDQTKPSSTPDGSIEPSKEKVVDEVSEKKVDLPVVTNVQDKTKKTTETDKTDSNTDNKDLKDNQGKISETKSVIQTTENNDTKPAELVKEKQAITPTKIIEGGTKTNVAEQTNVVIADGKASESNEKTEQKSQITITETFDFVGEKIVKTKVVDVNSAEAKSYQDKPKTQLDPTKPGSSSSGASLLSAGIKRPGGLGSVLGNMDKKKKMSVLDKSKYDWDNYKDEMGLEDELKSNRNAGYLDRQEFLQRVDHKQWENEREMRLYSNHK